jgi:hypothetical protein
VCEVLVVVCLLFVVCCLLFGVCGLGFVVCCLGLLFGVFVCCLGFGCLGFGCLGFGCLGFVNFIQFFSIAIDLIQNNFNVHFKSTIEITWRQSEDLKI